MGEVVHRPGKRGLRCPRAPFDDHSCPSLMWGVLDRAQSAGAGFSWTQAGAGSLADLRWRAAGRRSTQLLQQNSAKPLGNQMTPTDSAAIASIRSARNHSNWSNETKSTSRRTFVNLLWRSIPRSFTQDHMSRRFSGFCVDFQWAAECMATIRVRDPGTVAPRRRCGGGRGWPPTTTCRYAVVTAPGDPISHIRGVRHEL